jgi:hypothetical protein
MSYPQKPAERHPCEPGLACPVPPVDAFESPAPSTEWNGACPVYATAPAQARNGPGKQSFSRTGPALTPVEGSNVEELALPASGFRSPVDSTGVPTPDLGPAEGNGVRGSG